MSVTATKLFQPLTGTELKAIITADIDRVLENCSIFAEHLTHPLAAYKVEIYLESYPMNSAETLRAEGAIKVEGSQEGEKKLDKIVFSRSVGDTQETAPDALRQEHDLPQTRPTKQPDTGIITDAPQPTSVSVGKGTIPRPKPASVTVGKAATKAKVEEVSENAVDDTGEPVKINSF